MAKEKAEEALITAPSPGELAIQQQADADAAQRAANFRRFDVCLLNGSRLARVAVTRIRPRTERQKMQRLNDKGQPVVEIVDVPVDVDAEMAADAIRAYNGSGPEATNYTAKQLTVVAVD